MADDTMMTNAEAAARALLDRRIELIRELTAATSELEPLQKAAAEGEQRVLNAWTEALAGGWTADELKQLGLPEPDRKAMAKKAPPKQRGGSGGSGSASSAAATPAPPAAPAPAQPPAPPAAPAAETADASAAKPAEEDAAAEEQPTGAADGAAPEAAA